MKKKIILACDHGGVELKLQIQARLAQAGHELVDMGVNSPETSVDYPHMAEIACKAYEKEQADCVLLFCGTGLGIGIAANKIPGIRAVTCSDSFSARMAKEHNNANVLCLGGRVLGIELAWEVLQSYLQAEFQGDRHQRRIDMISALEQA